ncbi:MAG: dienelactone hydrolase family protein [Phycisphaerae bacterium]
MKQALQRIAVLALLALAGCGIPIFPIWPAEFFDESPAEIGDKSVRQYRVDVPDGADGMPAGITIFAPEDVDGPLPALIWVLGSNVQPYYQQSLHETLASWGYAVIIPEGRPLTFTDFSYHRRTIDLAKQALDLALAGALEVEIDEDRIAVGGYSIGGTLAALMAVEDDRAKAIVMWAPTSSPFWTGVEPSTLYPLVTQPSYFLLAEFDTVEPPDGYPQEMQAQMTNSAITEYIIPQGLHLFFQQPTAADDNLNDPETELTRFEQQGIAIERTRAYLDEQLAVD